MRRSELLEKVLADIRQEHRDIRAPYQLPAKLREVTEARQSATIPRLWAWAFAAALLISVIIWRGSKLQWSGQLDRTGEGTAFVEIPGSQGLPPPMATSILRLQVRKGELRQYGIQVAPALDSERMQADFLVGDDGLARAVRVVQ